MPIQPIPNDDTLPFEVVATSFQQDYTDAFGTEMDEADGFDDIFEGVAALVEPDIAVIETMASDLSTADFSDGDLSTGMLSQLNTDYANTVYNGYYAINNAVWEYIPFLNLVNSPIDWSWGVS